MFHPKCTLNILQTILPSEKSFVWQGHTMVRLKHFSDVINITKSRELDSAITNDIQEKVFFESPQSEQTETRERRSLSCPVCDIAKQ